MENFKRYTEEYTYPYNKIESYCYNMKTEMYNDWPNGSEWDSVEVMEQFNRVTLYAPNEIIKNIRRFVRRFVRSEKSIFDFNNIKSTAMFAHHGAYAH